MKRIGISPIKPRKLTKKDIYPTVNEKIEQNDEKLSDKEENEEKDESPRVAKQIVQTNSTVLSKQIKIVSQLNAKQINISRHYPLVLKSLDSTTLHYQHLRLTLLSHFP